MVIHMLHCALLYAMVCYAMLYMLGALHMGCSFDRASIFLVVQYSTLKYNTLHRCTVTYNSVQVAKLKNLCSQFNNFKGELSKDYLKMISAVVED